MDTEMTHAQRVETLRSLSTLDIVRALAAVDPIIDDGIVAVCVVCHEHTKTESVAEPSWHGSWCPWRMAREYFANPPSISRRLERASERVSRLRHGELDGG